MVILNHHRLMMLIICFFYLVVPIQSRNRDTTDISSKSTIDMQQKLQMQRQGTPLLVLPNKGSSSYHYGGISRNPLKHSESNEPIDSTGFCTRHRDMKLICHCSPDDTTKPVQKAECWILSDGLLQNDTTWVRFISQKYLRDIKFVVQNHGRLDFIPTLYIQYMKNLTSISIEYSQIEAIRSQAFASLNHLERIILTNNQLMTLEKEAFANHIRLRELNLEHNQIYEIDHNAFRNLPLCESLQLNNNNISNLHEGLFAEMVRLVYLNLAYNQISVLTSDIFKGLGNLKILRLSHNNLNFIGDTVFAELWSLAELELDGNRIERLSERALDGLNNLKTINLRNNMLKKLDNGLLRGTPAVLFINVQGNQLETLTFYTFQPIMDNLVNSTSELLLSDNEFICDCRLQWIFELKNRTRHQQLRNSLEEFVCTIYDPKISNFIAPVPTHILDILNIGSTDHGYHAAYSSNAMSAADSFRRKHSFKPHQMYKSEDMVLASGNAASAVDVSFPGSPKVDQTAMINRRSLIHVSKSFPTNYPSFQAHQQQFNVRDNYYGESEGLFSGQPVNTVDSLTTWQYASSLAQQQNGVLSTKKRDDVTDSKQPFGFKVRLFTLKMEYLPCYDELSDPTELPLSRDLMDVRSNSHNSSASSAYPQQLQSAVAALVGLTIFCTIGGFSFGLRVSWA